MNDIVGSIRKVVLDGITFDVAGDCNISEVGGEWENDAVATSGRNMRKMTKRPATREGVVILCNGPEFETVQDFAAGRKDIPLAYETASADVYRATGWIEVEKRETEEGRCTLKLFPRTKWEPFFA